MTTPTPTLIRDPWRRVWHALASPAALVTVVNVIAVLLLLTVLLPQIPPNDPVAYSRWLSEAQQRFGNLVPALTSLGLFSITQSVLFRLALAGLGLMSTLRLLEAFDQLRAANTLPDRPLNPIVDHTLAADGPTVLAGLRRFRLREIAGGWVADRGVRTAAWASVLVHTGVLIVLIGLALGTFIDWRADDVSVEPGSVTPLSGTPYGLRLDATDQRQATLALLNQTETVAQGVTAPRQPLMAGGLTIYLTDIGPAVIISATNDTGQPLALLRTADSAPQTHLLLAFTPDRTEGFVAAPDAQVVLQVARQAPGYAVQAYQSASGEILAGGEVSVEGRFKVNTSTFYFSPAAFITVAAVNQPSHVMLAAGLMLTVLGLALGRVRRPQRLWLIAVEGGTRVVSADASFKAEDLLAARPRRRVHIGRAVIVTAWLVLTVLLLYVIVSAYPISAAPAADPLFNLILGLWLSVSSRTVV